MSVILEPGDDNIHVLIQEYTQPVIVYYLDSIEEAWSAATCRHDKIAGGRCPLPEQRCLYTTKIVFTMRCEYFRNDLAFACFNFFIQVDKFHLKPVRQSFANGRLARAGQSYQKEFHGLPMSSSISDASGVSL